MLEIERKFLMTKRQFDSLDYLSCAVLEMTYHITQGYLVNKEDVIVRVRIDRRIGNKTRPPQAILCVKKPVDGSHLVRTEDEYEIDIDLAYNILDQTETLDKVRYRFHPYVIDVFRGDLTGLIIAEREYETKEEALADVPPHWVEEDVTESIVYLNSCLIGKKFINGTVA